MENHATVGLRVVKNVHSTTHFCHDEGSHWADLFASRSVEQLLIVYVTISLTTKFSRPEQKEPMVAGYWRHDDTDKCSDSIEAEWDEMKYVLTGNPAQLDKWARIDSLDCRPSHSS
jgi:hypothetical protein